MKDEREKERVIKLLQFLYGVNVKGCDSLRLLLFERKWNKLNYN